MQQPKLSSVECHVVAMLTVKTLNLLTDNNFDLLWENKRDQVDIAKPQVARRRKVTKRYDYGSAPAEFALAVKENYRQVYFEALA